MAKILFISKFPGLKLYLEEVETPLSGNRVKRHLRKVEFVGGKFETSDEKLIAELREHDVLNKDFHEVKNQVPGQGAGTPDSSKK